MPLYRVTFLFGYPAMNAGWSETYVQQATDVLAATASCSVLISTRLGLAVAAVSFMGYRVSQTDPQKDGIVNPPPTGMNNGTYAGSPGTLNPAPNSLLVRLDSDTETWFNHKYLRGVPPQIFQGRKYVPPAAPDPWIANWNLWVAELVSGKWFLTSRKPGTAGLVTISRVVPLHGTDRKYGRPFDLPVGRRRVA